MAIRNIAHAIQSGEISMGMAIGVENMTLKQVSNSLWYTNVNLRAALVLRLLLLNP
jgi:acetyl-CoA acetyltransferase